MAKTVAELVEAVLFALPSSDAGLDWVLERQRKARAALSELAERTDKYETALRTLTEKRITDGEGYATWAKSVARKALR